MILLLQYEVVYGTQTDFTTSVNYSDLEKIIIITIPSDEFLGRLSDQTLALALITPWNTGGSVASKENVYMTARKTPIVTDIRSLKATVGLVETRKKWGVIDCVPNKGTEAFTTGLTGDDGEDLLDDEEDML